MTVLISCSKGSYFSLLIPRHMYMSHGMCAMLSWNEVANSSRRCGDQYCKRGLPKWPQAKHKKKNLSKRPQAKSYSTDRTFSIGQSPLTVIQLLFNTSFHQPKITQLPKKYASIKKHLGGKIIQHNFSQMRRKFLDCPLCQSRSCGCYKTAQKPQLPMISSTQKGQFFIWEKHSE